MHDGNLCDALCKGSVWAKIVLQLLRRTNTQNWSSDSYYSEKHTQKPVNHVETHQIHDYATARNGLFGAVTAPHKLQSRCKQCSTDPIECPVECCYKLMF